jgi:uncharacterized protein with HEPN domain
MHSRDGAHLLDILNAATLVTEFVKSRHRSDLETDMLLRSAVLYQVAVIGEATKRLSREFREAHAEAPWRQIAGMRDVLIHGYDIVDLDTVWHVVSQSVPELLRLVEPLVPPETGPNASVPS